MNVVKIKTGESFAIINESDFDPDRHELFAGEKVGGKSSAQALADDMETRRQLDANRGVVNGSGPTDNGRNATGTYREPTPSDVRFPDMNATEFENNHGAFVGRAAPDLRAQMDMPDEPGGVRPEVKEAVEGATQVAIEAAKVAAAPEARAVPADANDKAKPARAKG